MLGLIRVMIRFSALGTLDDGVASAVFLGPARVRIAHKFLDGFSLLV